MLIALLVCNQNEDNNQTKDIDKNERMFPDIVPAVLLFNYSFAVSDIINFYFADYTYCQTIKALLLFGFLESIYEGTQLLKRFSDYFGIANWREYFERVIPIISAWANRDKPSSVDLILDKNNSYKSNYIFLQKLAMREYSKMQDLDYIKLREKPLIELDDKTFRVIHPLFISDKIYKGVYFLLNRLNEDCPRIIKSNFRSWYTTNFSEGICLREIIQYSLVNYDSLLFDNELRALKVIGPPDCYARNGDDAFLFENKDVLINAGIKSSYDFEAIIAEIKKKLFLENEKPVGIGQIITNIRKLLSKENTFDMGFNTETTCIYPILVVHDNMYDTVGLNKILNSIFEEEVEKLKNGGFDMSGIKSLVLVNIDTLIQIADLLKEGIISLKELFESYFENSELPELRPLKEEEITNTMIPFSAFANNYLNDKLSRQWRSENLFKYLFGKSNS